MKNDIMNDTFGIIINLKAAQIETIIPAIKIIIIPKVSLRQSGICNLWNMAIVQSWRKPILTFILMTETTINYDAGRKKKESIGFH